MTQWTRTTAAALRIQRLRALESTRELHPALPNQRPLLTSSKPIDKPGKIQSRKTELESSKTPDMTAVSTKVAPLLQRLRELSRDDRFDEKRQDPNQEYTSIKDELHRLALVQCSVETSRLNRPREACDPLEHLIEGSTRSRWQPISITINRSESREHCPDDHPYQANLGLKPLAEAYVCPSVYRSFIGKCVQNTVSLDTRAPSKPIKTGQRPKLVTTTDKGKGQEKAKDTNTTGDIQEVFLSLLT